MKKIISIVLTFVMITATVMGICMYASAQSSGDINNDGNSDNKDVVTLFRYVSNGEKTEDETVYDFNKDGVVDNKDVVSLFRVLSGGDVTEMPEAEDYKIYLYAEGENGTGGGSAARYKGKDFLGFADTTEKQNMDEKTVELFGCEHTMVYMQTLSFGIYDENYDMYIGDSGLFTFGETTGKLVTYDYLSGERASGFTPPVNMYSSRQEFIDYAKAVLLEYTGTSTDDCDVFVKTYGSKYNIVFRKKFNGIYRIDDIMVTINNNGDVINIKARVCDDKFEPFKDVKINAEHLEKQIRGLSYSPHYVSYECILSAIPDGNELWVLADVQYEYEEDGDIFGNGIQYITKVAEIPSGQTETETSETAADTWEAVWETEIE